MLKVVPLFSIHVFGDRTIKSYTLWIDITVILL